MSVPQSPPNEGTHCTTIGYGKSAGDPLEPKPRHTFLSGSGEFH